jgi:hypothetical protein
VDEDLGFHGYFGRTLPENQMDAFKLLFTTDAGLMSLGVILFIIVMGLYMSAHLKKLMNQKPGKEGWE